MTKLSFLAELSPFFVPAVCYMSAVLFAVHRALVYDVLGHI